MESNWMRDRLVAYEDLCRQYDAAYERGDGYGPLLRPLIERAERSLPTIRKIFELLDPTLADGIVTLGYLDANIGSRIQQALGILDDREEWAVHLTPDAPVLLADKLHPLVWQAASTLWATGEYRVAVQQATVALSTYIKAKAGSNQRDRALVQDVFSPDAKEGRVRLHLPGDRTEETWRSRQDGLHLIAQGAFAGIRNIAVHDEVEWLEHEALEHLAVLSVIARWTDETELIT